MQYDIINIINEHAYVWPVSQSCLTLCDPPGSSVHEILQGRNRSRLPFLSPGDLTDPGIEPTPLMSPALASGFFVPAPPRKSNIMNIL